MKQNWDTGEGLMRRLFYWSTAVHLVLFAIVAVVAKVQPVPFVKKPRSVRVVRAPKTPPPTQRVTPRPATPRPTKTPKPTPTKPAKTKTPKPKTPTPKPKTPTPKPPKKTVSRKTKTPKPKTPTPKPKTPTPWEPPIPVKDRKTPPPVTPALRTPPVVKTPRPVKTPDTPFDLESDAALLDEWYLEQARARIKAFFRYPSRHNKVGVSCDLSFTVARDGTISNVTTRKSSGNSLLDGYAGKALRDAERLPPLPETVKKAPLRLTVTFDFSGLDNP